MDVIIKTSNFLIKRVAIALLFILSVGTSYAQIEDVKRVFNDNKDKEYLQFQLYDLGINLWVVGPEATIVNDKGETIVFKDLSAPDCKFQLNLPCRVNNTNSSTMIYGVWSKNEVTKEKMAEAFIDAVLSNRAKKNENAEVSVRFLMDDNYNHIATSISFSTHYKHDVLGTVYANNTLVDLRYINAYTHIQTAQPSNTPIIVDSIAGMNNFKLDKVKPEYLLTQEQMDSQGDGFEFLTSVMEALRQRKLADGDTLDVEAVMNQFAFMYRDIFGKYPRSYEATHQKEIKERESHAKPSVMMGSQGSDKQREEDMKRFNNVISQTKYSNTKKVGNATIKTEQKIEKGAFDTSRPLVEMNKKGEVRMNNPLKQQENRSGSISVKW